MNEPPKNSPPGFRHLALRVRDMTRSRKFYQEVFDMQVVWEPDPENVYLSSGRDNLALHQIPPEELPGFQGQTGQFLDHFGWIVESPEKVKTLHETMELSATPIVKPLKTHRDGSVSFYITDPDENVIQILYEPHISPTP